MDADGNIVIAERFNRILDFYFFLVQVDIVLGLGRFADSLARNGTEDFAAFADFNGNGQFDFLQLAGQDDGFIRSDLGLMLGSGFFCLASLRFSDVPGAANLRGRRKLRP